MINTEYNKFKARFNEETEMPHYIKSNNQWVKDLYKDLKTRQKEVPPDMGSTALGKVNSLVSNFEKDAENIYNLNVDGRENPTLKEYMKTRYAHPAIQNILVENKSKPQNTVVNSGVTATNKLYNENSGKLLKTPETMKKSTEIVKLNSVENTPSASNNAAPAQTENQPITAGSSPIQGKEGLSEKEKPVINNDIQGTAGDNKNTKESIPVIIYDPDSNSFENSDSSKITEKTSGTDKQVYLPDEKYDVIWKYTGEVSDCLGSDLEKTAASADWLMPDEYVPVYDKETGKVSYCMAKDLREKLQSGKWALDTDGVKLINKCTGEEVSCKGNEIADSIQNGGCLSPNTRVTVYNRITGEASECYASEIAEKRKGDFATAKDGIVVINAYTGERSTCSADELYAKIQSGGFYSEKQRVPVYDPISGKTSYCWAYELADKKKNKVWVVASDGVERIDPLSGDRRTVKAYEVEGEANSGTSYSPGQRINLYDPSSGAANACFAYELKGYKQKGFLTGDETVKIYNGVTFKEADCKSKNLAGMRGGKGSSKWYTGDEIVTLYDAWNKPVKVKANAAASRLTGQNRLYTSKMFPDNDEIWASIINKTPQQLQDEYNKKLAETFTNASKLTRKKVKGNDGNFYLDVSSPDDTYTETGFPKAFYYDLFDMARSGSMDAGTVFDIMLGATTSAAAGADYVCDGFTVVKKDGYVIIKGARSDAAIGKGILGTRYKITPDSPHTNVMAYVDAKAAIKEAFTSGIGKFMIVAGVAVSTADDVINAINSGKSNKEIAATLVVSLGVNTVMTAITTVASAAVGAAIGTPFIGGFFGSLIGIGIGYITTGVVKITKEAATEQLTKLLDIVM